jgi:hypothetical protein
MADPIVPSVEQIPRQRAGKKLYPRAGEAPDSPGHLLRRLLNGVEINDQTGCWEWQRARNNHSYGTITVYGRGRVFAHRLMWELAAGPIPARQGVLHECDTPFCLNPAHLFLGDQLANMQDCAAKGRVRAPGGAVSACRLLGLNNPATKLTEEAVSAIRRRLTTGTESQAEIARDYGVSQSQVSNIKRGRQRCQK